MPTDVFLSYQSLDQECADRIYQALGQRGFSCWMASRDIQPGEEWSAAIHEAIRNCRCLILLLSSHSRSYKQIARELEMADRNSLKIIPIRIEDVQPTPSVAYFIENVQWLDAFNQNFDAVIVKLTARLGASPQSSPHSFAETAGTVGAAGAAHPEAISAPAAGRRSSISTRQAAWAAVLVLATLAGVWFWNRPRTLPTNPISQKQSPQKPELSVLLSDNFARPDAGPCNLGRADFSPAGVSPFYYMPVFQNGAKLVLKGLQNGGLDAGGVQIAAFADTCVANHTPSARFPQNLRIWVDVLVPSDRQGHISRAGPYFRSRAAAPFDGIVGGSSGGCWIQLLSTGEVIILQLNPPAILARSGRPSAFDHKSVHTLEAGIHDEELQVVLDGGLVSFFQSDRAVTTVAVPRTIGDNDGTVGVAFSAEDNRGKIGGQRVTKLIVSNYSPLGDRPMRPVGSL